MRTPVRGHVFFLCTVCHHPITIADSLAKAVNIGAVKDMKCPKCDYNTRFTKTFREHVNKYLCEIEEG